MKRVEVCEIDPAVYEIAKTYFGYKDHPNVKVVLKDAKSYLSMCKKKFDIIFLDAFDEVGPVEGFNSYGLIKSCKFALKSKDGVVISNAHIHVDFGNLVNVYRGIFDSTNILKVPGEGNAVIVGSPNTKISSKEEVITTAKEITESIKPYYDFEREVRYGVENGIEYKDSSDISHWIRSGLSNWK